MLKMILPQGYNFPANDYNRLHVLKIYNEDDTPFDASGFTSPMIKIFDDAGTMLIASVTGSWTSQASGNGTFSFSPTSRLTKPGSYFLETQLEKTDAIISTERRRIVVLASPP